MRGARILLFVAGFWLFVVAGVAWAIGLTHAINSGNALMVVGLAVPPAVVLSLLLGLMVSEMVD